MTVQRLAHPSFTHIHGIVDQWVGRARSAFRWMVGSVGTAVAFVAPLIWLAAWLLLLRSAIRTGVWF